VVRVTPDADETMRHALAYPRLRAVTPEWTEHQGQPMLLLRDHLRLADQSVLVPPPLAVLLGLFDGRRDQAAIRSAYQDQTGESITATELDRLIGQLAMLLLLDSPQATAAYQAATAAYRTAPFRPPALAGRVYPADRQELARQIDGWLADAGRRGGTRVAPGRLRGVVCPHIDYGRGAAVYADVWLPARAAVAAADVIIVFGTDHHGSAASVTPTRQRYATPCGVLENDRPTVDALAAALGEETAFAEELHHRDEHSIELAIVWLQHLLAGKATPIVPILTGSFHPFTQGRQDAAAHAPFAAAMAALRSATRGRRVLVVAAADLAHTGPAFGDPDPLDVRAKERIGAADAALLTALCTGSAEAFLAPLLADHDERRICGLPPIYLTLRYLAGSSGIVTSYRQCPADAAFGSLVSAAGVLLE
jgi:AmmeMemoRadiSam system protein B